MINYENAKKGLCVACGTRITGPGRYRCHQCRQFCEVFTELRSPGNILLVDVTSQCCRSDVDLFKKLTCSHACHEEYVAHMEREFGTHKRIERTSTGEAFRVPTRTIIETGVNERDLDKFPRWE